MLLSAVSVLVVALPNSQFPEGLMNYPVYYNRRCLVLKTVSVINVMDLEIHKAATTPEGETMIWHFCLYMIWHSLPFWHFLHLQDLTFLHLHYLTFLHLHYLTFFTFTRFDTFTFTRFDFFTFTWFDFFTFTWFDIFYTYMIWHFLHLHDLTYYFFFNFGVDLSSKYFKPQKPRKILFIFTLSGGQRHIFTAGNEQSRIFSVWLTFLVSGAKRRNLCFLTCTFEKCFAGLVIILKHGHFFSHRHCRQ
jgi:hypothetical protein